MSLGASTDLRQSSAMLSVSNRNPRLTCSSVRPIHITSQDKERLADLLAEVAVSDCRKHGDLHALREELKRAVIVNPVEVPNDVITMNSRADLLDLESGETFTFTLVFLADANVEEGRISVLAPIGAGMLGYRVEDEFAWNVPVGVRRMRVVRVDYQPEAAGDFDR
ncbi:MAG TPA: GreA/GreB family elongation factor [Chthoniobacterales bacterium]|nr:GreA/GreB family elongation factor [Chthoniobacterales bacterium]